VKESGPVALSYQGGGNRATGPGRQGRWTGIGRGAETMPELASLGSQEKHCRRVVFR